ncbi:2-dehydro-3-deoxy-D-gluconate 5-dehydrogenase KduD [Opitutus sp. ER46]|uniref:2-dehydro-3-deoxy-D-gluconate 5-dehydrogenase KduD n=1 Tax=Opitutus sp. ER46 TaxID=2161864 RepID=UPI000D31D740|nr:2-dehydro-3-deoxy-D-gluconate 5-dehydrogenase KduD [Opitutus sp. ER46]PTX92722.1 2-deoxy-D-gluconate 3-dehydrogenase [Opitutus sp. ER46]
MSSILDSFKLNGKTALVTGAARGLGQGMALALAEAGADIVAVDILPADDTRKQVEAMGRKCATLAANLSDRSAIGTVVEEAKKFSSHLDILVNCAGIIRREDFDKFSEKDWDDVMGININAVFFLSQKFVQAALARQGKAKIINIASMLSFQGGIRVPSYTASKSAVQGLTRLIANEMASKGINCNAIAPGYMATDNTAPLRADANRSASILDRIPAGRWGTPDDLKGAVVFLASPASDYINGYTIAVDGGWLAR